MRLHEAVGSLRQEWEKEEGQLPFFVGVVIGVVMGTLFILTVVVPIALRMHG